MAIISQIESLVDGSAFLRLLFCRLNDGPSTICSSDGWCLMLSVWSLSPWFTTEPRHDKTNKMICAPSEDSDEPGHPPSLIRVFAVRMKKAWVLSYPLSAQRNQADLSLRWAHSHFAGFVMWRLNCNRSHQHWPSVLFWIIVSILISPQ